MNIRQFAKLACLLALTAASAGGRAELSTYTASQFAATPPFLSTSVDPFVLINLSVELTQQAEAFTDGEQTYANGTYCPGRKSFNPGEHWDSYGVCYSKDETYIGYFDPGKCYDYVEVDDERGRLQDANGPWQRSSDGDQPRVSYFKPAGFTNSDYECNGNFSGNFMNWISMTALDEFRYAMTGGARLVDTSGADAKTLLTRMHRYVDDYETQGDWDSFIGKAISEEGIWVNGETFTTDPSDVTPFDDHGDEDTIYVRRNGNYDNRIEFRDEDGDIIGRFNVVVEVCSTDVSLEDNCVQYSDPDDPSIVWYKPEGMLQKNALKMRYALTTYTAEDGNGINGGVLRANAKYIGYQRPSDQGGLEVNPVGEINADGTYRFDPDDASSAAGVVNSGILNYINMFGLTSGRYKSNDPASEIYYEGLRYLMGLSPTPSFSSNAIAYPHYKDGFPVYTDWDDPVTDACQKNHILYIGDQFTHADNYVPGKSCSGGDGGECSDIDFNADTLTDTVGSHEGIANLGDQNVPGMSGGYWIAGMSYWANTSDIRSDLEGDQRAKSFIVDTQEWNANPPTEEENPLWLAAKYGGFDLEGWSEGDAPTEAQWDNDGDGVPNTYTLASQPSNLISGLENAFNIIAAQVNAGSAAGVVSNTAEGQGMIVQGLFKPNHVEGDQKIEWGGLLHAIFIDENDHYREDANDNGQIDATDPAIVFEVANSGDEATISRYTVAVDGSLAETPFQTGVDIDNLDSLWDTRDRLAALDNETQIKNQRAYNTTASGGRYIFTAIDGSDGSERDGVLTHPEKVAFTETAFPAPGEDGNALTDNYAYLGLDDEEVELAPHIVNYIRGFEDADLGFRSRTIDYDADGGDEVWRLGDIVSSSPVVVAKPGDDIRYDRVHGDDTFREFYEQYEDRRQMVYVGTNDGMLHGINAGFFDPATRSFSATSGSRTPHPLGSEVWAYVPYNLLPHLKWLASNDYPHVYYMDGIPQVFDVNIFPDDADHPNGWGTILVIGMRLGGGDYSLEVPGPAGSTETVTTRSAYVVMDITNPEEPPELIAEISHPKLGYTTGRPTIMKKRTFNSDGDVVDNQWYLVFGSGPYGSDSASRTAALQDAVSNQTAKLFAFDLNNKAFVTRESGGETYDYFDVPYSNNGFVGDLTAVDWNDDLVDDVVYFGVVADSVLEPSGEFLRFKPGANFSLSNGTINRVLTDGGGSLDMPVSGKPYVRRFGDEYWVFIGAGRFFVPNDNLSDERMSYFGVKEPRNASGVPALSSSVSVADLLDTSDIRVEHREGQMDAAISDSDGSAVEIAGEAVGTFSALRRVMDDYSGWVIHFDDVKARNVGKSDGTGLDVSFTEYVGSGDACEPLGETWLNSVFYETGTAAPYSRLSVSDTVINDTDVSERSKLFSIGLVRDVDIKEGRFIGQGSLGDLGEPVVYDTPAMPSGRMSWREIQIDW